MPRLLTSYTLLVAVAVLAGCANTAPRAEPIAQPPAASDARTPESVAQIQSAIMKNPAMKFSVQGGWTVAKDSDALVLWAFTPVKHPAHPSAVKRRIINQGGNATIEMTVLCQADKTACSALVKEFEAKNNKIKRQIASRSGLQT